MVNNMGYSGQHHLQNAPSPLILLKKSDFLFQYLSFNASLFIFHLPFHKADCAEHCRICLGELFIRLCATTGIYNKD